MRKMIWAIGLVLSLTVCSQVLGQTALNSHDIMQRVASEVCVAAPVTLLSGLLVPQGWKLESVTPQKAVFHVPYHRGVGGSIEILSVPETQEAILAKVSEKTRIEFHQTSLEPIPGGHHAVYSGRLGGEVWHFVLVTLNRQDGGQVVYWAKAPETWFSVYALLFGDMIKSLGVE